MEGPFDQYDEHTFSSSVEPVLEALAAGAKRLGATVKAMDCALADEDGEITLFLPSHNRGESSVRINEVVCFLIDSAFCSTNVLTRRALPASERPESTCA
jgi:hypothetical protein